MQSLYLNKPIQVRTGDYRRQWQDAKVVYVCMEQTGVDEDEKPLYGLSFSVEFTDGCSQRVSDAFGWGGADWKYKEKCCEQCKWCSKEGGDIVPYGSTTTTLPEGYICEHEAYEDEDEPPYDTTNGGKECQYHEFIPM